jgi:NADH-quinone oxidoreductase subunit C
MTPEEIYHALQERFGERHLTFNGTALDPYVVVPAPAIHEVGEYLRHDSRLQFDSLMCLSGVDYGPDKTLEVVYHLHSTSLRHKMTLKVELPRQGGSMPTVSDIWRTAEWHEREAYDLFGMRFEQHPDQRRILLPDDWEGHPLLKDYQVQEFYHGIRVPYVGDPPNIGMDVYRYQDQEPT